VARHGYFAFSIEYRLDDVAKWPAQIEDCKLAVRYLRANAAQYHVDPNRIGVFGGSAGGHLVACLATMADQTQYDVGDYPGVSSAVQAVVDFFGPTDFTRPEAYSPGAIKLTEGLLGMPYAENPEAWKSASPVFFVKAGDPPVLIVQGAADRLVPPAQSIEFDNALAQAGVEHHLILVKNGDHSFKPNPPGSKIDPPWSGINAALYAFFDAHLKQP
jgi:acetyl esterase/lipase